MLSPRLLGGKPHTFDIQVVDGNDGLPVAGAEVLFLAENLDLNALGFAERVHARRLSSMREAFLLRYGAIERTGVDGRVELRLTADTQWIVCRSGNLRGEVEIPLADLGFESNVSRHRIELERSVSLAVQTVDASGFPKRGIDVVVTFGVGGAGTTFHADDPQAEFTVTRPVWADRNRGDWTALMMRPQVFGAAPAGVAVDILDPPSDPLLLPCPATGRLLVRWEGQQKGAPRSPGDLVLVTEEAATGGPRASYGVGQVMRGIAMPDGCFLFPAVALHVRFAPIPVGPSTLVGFEPTLTGGVRHHVFAGPGREGETKHVFLERDHQAPVLTGALIGPDGSAVADVGVSVEMSVISNGERYDPKFRVPVDSVGRFTLLLPPYMQSVRPAETWLKVLDDADRWRGVMARVECPAVPRGETVDLGAIRVARPPALVSLYLRRPDGSIVRAVHGLQVRRVSDSGADVWVDRWPEYTEMWSDGGIAYYSAARGRWRVVFPDPDGPGGRRGGFSDPIEFDAGVGRLDVHGHPR